MVTYEEWIAEVQSIMTKLEIYVDVENDMVDWPSWNLYEQGEEPVVAAEVCLQCQDYWTYEQLEEMFENLR